MSIFDTLRSRVQGLFGTKPPALHTGAVSHDRFDAMAWQDVRDKVPAIGAHLDRLRVDHDYVDDLAQDAYNLLVKGDPQVHDAADMAPTHLPNRAMVASWNGTTEWQQLRTLTESDPYDAAMAWVAMKDVIGQAADKLDEAREDAKRAEQARQDAADAAQQAQDALQQAQDAADAAEAAPDDEDAAQAAADAAQAVQDALDQAEAAAGVSITALDDANVRSEQAAAGIRAAIKSAAAEAANEREDERALFNAFGKDDGDLKRMPFEERARLAQRLRNNRMAKFARLIGSFKQMSAAEQRRRVNNVPDEIVGVTLGDDLQRLTGGELVNLGIPELQDDFWLRWANRQLVVYDLAGNEKMGQGPIVVVVDESASMTAALGDATREAWSKAFTLALLDQAKRESRDFHYIGFSSASQVWHKAFPAGRGDIADVIDVTEHFFSGGTSYEGPLLLALQIITEQYADRRLPKPDVVFITDEQHGRLGDDFMHQWNAVKDEQSLRCFGIAMVPTVNGALAAVADNVRSITDLTDAPQHVADILRII